MTDYKSCVERPLSVLSLACQTFLVLTGVGIIGIADKMKIY